MFQSNDAEDEKSDNTKPNEVESVEHKQQSQYLRYLASEDDISKDVVLLDVEENDVTEKSWQEFSKKIVLLTDYLHRSLQVFSP